MFMAAHPEGPSEKPLRGAELLERFWTQAREVEARFEESILRQVSKLKLPKREQVQALHLQLDRLDERLSRLEGGRS